MPNPASESKEEERRVGLFKSKNMKRTLLTCITAMMAFPLFAQNGYEGAGFYRIQNQGEAGRYVSIENDKVSEESKKISFAGGKSVSANIEALKTVKNQNYNPGTIIYVSGNTSGLTLEAQGMNTDELLAKFGYSGYKLKMSGQGELEHSYETLFTSFAYQLSEGMKAYYIGRHSYDPKQVEEPIAELIEIANGKIPAATPVIIECSSSNVADNKVTLLNEELTAISGNALKGRVFCFIPTQSEDQNMKNALEFNKNSMCVLGMKDVTRGDRGETTGAKLVLITESNNDYNISSSLTNGYIPANKAYLPLNNISSSEADAIAKKGIRLLLPADYDVATSISKVVSEDKVVKEGIYTLTGVKVKDTNSTENLPSGIYIINGKKQVIR